MSEKQRRRQRSERLLTLNQQLDACRRELDAAAPVVREALESARAARDARPWRVAERAGRLAGRAPVGPVDPYRSAIHDTVTALKQLDGRLNPGPPRKGSAGARAPRATVVSWDMGNAGVMRAYHLADLLSRRCEVTMIGPDFADQAADVWEPIRNSRVRIRRFAGEDLPGFVQAAERAIHGIQTDLVYACQPKLPSLLIAMMLKHVHGVPVIVDIAGSDGPRSGAPAGISLEQLALRRGERAFTVPDGPLWTSACESLVGDADALTVSNGALKQRYGGTIVPEARDERLFDPAHYDWAAVRAELGYRPEDRVILFVGTPRHRTALVEIAEALEQLDDPRCKLCVVGSLNDLGERIGLAQVAARRTQLLGPHPVGDVPRLTAAADLVVLPHDGSGRVDGLAMPGKLVEALAMRVPVLAHETPALERLIADGVISSVGQRSLADRIAELFATPNALRRQTEHGRRHFLEHMSYNAAIESLDGVIATLQDSRRELPGSWGQAYGLARSAGTELPRIAGTGDSASAAPSRNGRIPPTTATWDIVSFWRLPYSGIYGRRADMLTKYLAQSDRTRRLVHFDKPTDWAWLDSRSRAARVGVNHWNLIARRGRRLALTGGQRDGKLRSYMLVAVPPKDPSRWQEALLPTSDEYLGFVAETLERNGIGKRPVLFWVWPPNFEFATVHEAFSPAFTVSDVVDDERSWASPGSARYEQLTRNHQEVFDLSDLVITHNEPLAERLRWYGVEPAVVPNATELFKERRSRRPREMRHLKGPIIGYSGTLSYRIDLELMGRIARERPECQLVIVGSAHGPEDVLALDEYPNVHFLGVRTYPDVARYIRCFDVAIIPHLDDEMSRGMNPLKGYLYASCGVPAVSTRIANLDLATLPGAIRITDTHDGFLAAIDEVIAQRRSGSYEFPTRAQLEPHTWAARVREIEALIDTVTA